MRFSLFLFRILRLVLPLCIIATAWLYLYPIFHGCAFPTPSITCASDTCHPASSAAPFRLLALGDPQLEGDSSLPKANDPVFPSLGRLWTVLQAPTPLFEKSKESSACFAKFWKEDVIRLLVSSRKRLDLWGNDHYLAHIYRSVQWWTRPTHVSVLGDLLGSQWIGDTEFERRGRRFWDRVFKDAERVPDLIMEGSETGPWVEELGLDKAWNKRVINIAGNHDVGYAGDLTEHRVDRFEKLFGKVNWEVIFTLPNHTYPRTPRAAQEAEPAESTEDDLQDGQIGPPALRIVVLNSMNLDTVAISTELQTATYEYLNSVISRSRPVEDHTTATILLTHIPLHKEAGICVDAPFFDFYQSGGVREQNHLSPFASKNILEGIFGLSGSELAPGRGLGRTGIVINGHDHEGCDVVHYVNRSSAVNPEIEHAGDSDPIAKEPQWQAIRTPENVDFTTLAGDDTPHVREVTLRAMMGEFGGYAGFLSAWFDESLGERGEWTLEYASCNLGVQHWWWAVHVLDLVVLITTAIASSVWIWEKGSTPKAQPPPKDKKVISVQAQQKKR